ncbi:hypothetical protein [Rhabdochromatium marinum]|uniref:hypothetical protein n=1 Tax=Rhabdochromatium marinum TaxID=48729 RepID=UPI001902DCD8|nr:hypothetical protein [Rhabdochromatium marinum]
MAASVKIINPPARLKKEEYSEALNQYLNRFQNASGIKALATMGSVKAPGLSDLDVIVVVNDDILPLSAKKLSTKGINDSIFLHGPIVIPESLVSELQWIIYATNIQVIWGSASFPKFSDLKYKYQSFLAGCYLVDFCESRMLQFSAMRTSGIANKREWLTRIWSVTHSIDIAIEFLGYQADENAAYLFDLVKAPRINWLNGEEVSDKQFIESLDAAEKLNEILFIAGLGFLYKKEVEKITDNLFLPPKKFIFSDNIDYIRYTAKTIRFLKKNITIWSCVQDKRYFKHICDYRKFQDSNSCLDAKKESIQKYVMCKRAKTIGKHWKWIRKYAKKIGTMSGYLGYSNHDPISLKYFAIRLLIKKLNFF